MTEGSIISENRRARPDIGPFVPPRTAAETRLAAIVSEILEIDRVGLRDGFLDLGGDSLTATLLAVQVQDAFGVALEPSIIFDSPDLATLAAGIEQTREGTGAGAAPAPSCQVRPERIPLSSEQQILHWLHQMNDDKAGYNVTRAVRIRTKIDGDLLGRALTALLARHEILRTRFVVDDDLPAQIIDPPGEAELETVDLRETAAAPREEAARRQVGLFLRRPFAVETDRLFRACLVRLAENDQILALSMHHLVSDGGSVVLIFSELGTDYAALASGRSAELARPALQYADYTLWQSAAYAEIEDRQVAFWSAYLEGVRTTQWLRPAPEPRARRYKIGTHPFSLPVQLTARVRELSRREDVTIAMTLFAANQIILAKLCRAEDMVGGMTFSRRTRPAFQDVAGPMLVTYPVRTPIAPNGSFRALLRYVKSTLLEVYGHLEIDGVAMARRMTMQAWPMTNFNLIGDRGGPAKRLEEGLRTLDPTAGVADFAVPEVDGGTAPIDFSIELYEHGDRIAGKIVYGLDVFDAEFIAGIAGELETLLVRAVDDPGQALSVLTARP